MAKNTAKKAGRAHASLLTKLLILLLLAGIGMQLLSLQEDVKAAEVTNPRFARGKNIALAVGVLACVVVFLGSLK